MNAPQIRTVMSLGDWGLLVLLALLWGASFFFVGVAVKEWPPLTVVVVRVLGGAIFLWPMVYAVGQRMPFDRVVWGAFFGMGFLNNVIPFCLNFWGQTHITSGVASILNATSPLFTVIVAHYFTADEKMTIRHVAGVLLGLAGVAVMVGPDALRIGDHAGFWSFLGQMAIVLAAISYAFAGTFARRFRQLGVTPMATAAGQVTASSIMMIPIALVVDRPWTLHLPSWGALGAMAGLAILSTALAYIVYFRLLARAGARNSMLVTFLLPIVAIFLGVVLLGEVIHLRQIAGMALIGLGLAAIDGRIFGLFASGTPERGP
jgi:drug/metabolite transporter (DMT)-like permease